MTRIVVLITLMWMTIAIHVCPSTSYVFLSIDTILVHILSFVNVQYVLRLYAFTIYNGNINI